MVISTLKAGILGLVLAAALSPSPLIAHGTDPDAGTNRSVLSVDVYVLGDTVDLLTAERANANAAPGLWYRRSADGGKSWSQPVRVGDGMPIPHQPHRSNDPQIASSGSRVVAVWGSAGGGFRSSGPMVTALSNDGGKTWKRGPNPADDNRHDGHGFADLIARDGRFHLTWLDSRSGAQGVRAAYARSDDGGASWSADVLVLSWALASAAGIRYSRGQTAGWTRSSGARDRATWASPPRSTTVRSGRRAAP